MGSGAVEVCTGFDLLRREVMEGGKTTEKPGRSRHG